MKKTLLTIIVLVPCLTFGTSQFPEKIIYNGTTNTLYSYPIDKDLVRGINDRTIVDQDGVTRTMTTSSTACHRGYIGTWEIRDKSLCLIRLQNAMEHDIPANKLISNASYPIKADWFSGELRIGSGDRAMNISSTEIFLTLTNGVISAEAEIIDRRAEEEAFKKELTAMKDSTNQLERDLYEYIYHYNGPRESNPKFTGLLQVISEELDEISFPSCNAFNRASEPENYIRSYIHFLPTSEPRLYRVESIYKKLNNRNSIHYVTLLNDKAFSFYGHPYEKLSIERENGRLHSIKTTDPEKAQKEAFDTMVRFRNMLKDKTLIPDEKAFSISTALSTNVLSVTDTLTVALTVSNNGSETINLSMYDLDVEFLLEEANHTSIHGLGRSDWIVRGIESPLLLKAGESKTLGQIQAGIRNGTWTDYSANKGPLPQYQGIGLEVKDAILETGYPLEPLPDDYFISVLLRIEREDGSNLEFLSAKQKVHIAVTQSSHMGMQSCVSPWFSRLRSLDSEIWSSDFSGSGLYYPFSADCCPIEFRLFGFKPHQIGLSGFGNHSGKTACCPMEFEQFG